MILVDTSPLVALFDADDSMHMRCRRALDAIRHRMVTTLPVLTEAFYMLGPASSSSALLRDFVANDAVDIWSPDRSGITRVFELMEKYADHPMDFADASIVAAAEALDTRRVFTLDKKDFNAYRVRRGHRHEPFDIVP